MYTWLDSTAARNLQLVSTCSGSNICMQENLNKIDCHMNPPVLALQIARRHDLHATCFPCMRLHGRPRKSRLRGGMSMRGSKESCREIASTTHLIRPMAHGHKPCSPHFPHPAWTCLLCLPTTKQVLEAVLQARQSSQKQGPCGEKLKTMHRDHNLSLGSRVEDLRHAWKAGLIGGSFCFSSLGKVKGAGFKV